MEGKLGDRGQGTVGSESEQIEPLGGDLTQPGVPNPRITNEMKMSPSLETQVRPSAQSFGEATTRANKDSVLSLNGFSNRWEPSRRELTILAVGPVPFRWVGDLEGAAFFWARPLRPSH